MVVALRSSFHRSRAILMLFIRIGLVVGAPSSSVVESGLCAGATAIEFQFVHVPKSGGKTLECTFEEGYRRRLIPCRVLGQTRVPVRIDGRHRTLAELELTERSERADTYQSDGSHILYTPSPHPTTARLKTVGRLCDNLTRFAVKTPISARVIFWRAPQRPHDAIPPVDDSERLCLCLSRGTNLAAANVSARSRARVVMFRRLPTAQSAGLLTCATPRAPAQHGCQVFGD